MCACCKKEEEQKKTEAHVLASHPLLFSFSLSCGRRNFSYNIRGCVYICSRLESSYRILFYICMWARIEIKASYQSLWVMMQCTQVLYGEGVLIEYDLENSLWRWRCMDDWVVVGEERNCFWLARGMHLLWADGDVSDKFWSCYVWCWNN